MLRPNRFHLRPNLHHHLPQATTKYHRPLLLSTIDNLPSPISTTNSFHRTPSPSTILFGQKKSLVASPLALPISDRSQCQGAAHGFPYPLTSPSPESHQPHPYRCLLSHIKPPPLSTSPTRHPPSLLLMTPRGYPSSPPLLRLRRPLTHDPIHHPPFSPSLDLGRTQSPQISIRLFSVTTTSSLVMMTPPAPSIIAVFARIQEVPCSHLPCPSHYMPSSSLCRAIHEIMPLFVPLCCPCHCAIRSPRHPSLR